MSDSNYDVVVDVLQKHHDKLMEVITRDMSSESLGLGIMNSIRADQCEQLKEAIAVWKAHLVGDTI